jgi:hypothetical protein
MMDRPEGFYWPLLVAVSSWLGGGWDWTST